MIEIGFTMILIKMIEVVTEETLEKMIEIIKIEKEIESIKIEKEIESIKIEIMIESIQIEMEIESIRIEIVIESIKIEIVIDRELDLPMVKPSQRYLSQSSTSTQIQDKLKTSSLIAEMLLLLNSSKELMESPKESALLNLEIKSLKERL